MNKIHINIWDDFYEDGYVPDGEKQSTYIYVEESDVELEAQRLYLNCLLTYMKTLDLPNVEMKLIFNDSSQKYPSLIGTENEWLLFKRFEISVDNLTHKRLGKLVKELQDANLCVNGHQFKIYSES